MLLVSLGSKEDIKETSLEYRTLSMFAKNDIGKFFNISFLDFLKLPISTHKMMIEIAREMMKRTSSALSDVAEQLELL